MQNLIQKAIFSYTTYFIAPHSHDLFKIFGISAPIYKPSNLYCNKGLCADVYPSRFQCWPCSLEWLFIDDWHNNHGGFEVLPRKFVISNGEWRYLNFPLAHIFPWLWTVHFDVILAIDLDLFNAHLFD